MCFRGGGLSSATGFSYRFLATRRRRILGSRAGGSECDETHVPCLPSRLHRGSHSAIRKPVPLKPTPRRCRWHQRLSVVLLSRPGGLPMVNGGLVADSCASRRGSANTHVSFSSCLFFVPCT